MEALKINQNQYIHNDTIFKKNIVYEGLQYDGKHKSLTVLA